jgi:hypothetical protein
VQQEEAYIFVAETEELDRMLNLCIKGTTTLAADSTIKLLHRMEHISRERFLAASEKVKLTDRRKGNEKMAQLYYNYRF